MDAIYTAEDNKRKERSTSEKRCIQSWSNNIEMIELIFESKIRKRGDSMFPAPSGRGGKKVGVQTKKYV